MVSVTCHLLLAAVISPVHLLGISVFLKRCSENIPLASSLSGLSDVSELLTVVKYIQTAQKQATSITGDFEVSSSPWPRLPPESVADVKCSKDLWLQEEN